MNVQFTFIRTDPYKIGEGSPFSNYSSVHKALGLQSSSKICFRYIDTGKLYKQQYIISSIPIKDI